MPRWLKPRGLIEGADMEVRFRRPGQTFARKGRTAPGAKSAARSPRRRIELGYFSFSNLIRRAVECHEDRNRRTGVLSTALAMAPIFPFRFASGDKADCSAETAAFELLDRTAHNLILHPWFWLPVGFFRQS